MHAIQALREEGLVEHLGLTGLGRPEALVEVIRSGQFATLQTPYHILNPSAGQTVAADFPEVNYGNLIAACEENEMGVFAIRVFAGGALADQPPSAHTHNTPFFPLDLFGRDQQRVRQFKARLEPNADLKEIAFRFVLSHPGVTSAIVGFGESSHVDDALSYANAGPLSNELLDQCQNVISCS